MPEQILAMLAIGGVTIVGWVVITLGNAYAQRLTRGGPGSALPADFRERWERMEHTLDAVAIEVERLSEAQRFTAKLLAEQRGPAIGGSAREGAQLHAPGALGSPPSVAP